MSNRPSYNQRKAARAFKRLGFEIDKSSGKGSHWCVIHLSMNAKFTLPQNKGGDYPPGYYNGIESYLSKCGFTYDDFLEKL